jgi:RNA polymerase sigma-70 factor (ECF subfamily)
MESHTMPPISSVLDDNALVAAARGGDRGSLETLLRRHYDRVHAVCRRVTGHEADAADAAQEAMILVVRNLGKFDGRSSFGTWIYRIATNASLDELRRRRRRPVVGAGTVSPGGERYAGAPDPIDPNSGARLDAIGDQLLLDAALAGLAEEFRVPVVLRDVAGLDYAEISEVLGVPVGTVKSRIARGRAHLAGALGRTYGNHPRSPERPTGAP